MASVFTKIINGEIPSYKVAENDDYLAFLDVNPLVKGHVLVVPKKEVDYIFDLSDNTLSGLMVFSKEIAKKMDKVLDCKRIGVTVIGLEVPHAHVHLIPINNVADMDFTKSKKSFSEEEMKETAKLIREA
ncbi:MAG: HIT family protein [Brumimicrobium sp.]|nr:HIT family protein [Brumimicrobium sp.]